MESIRSVETCLTELQNRTENQEGGFSFIFQMCDCDEDAETEMFQFAFGRYCHSINNPVLSRQLGIDETFTTHVDSIHDGSAEMLLKSYAAIEAEATAWQEQFNPLCIMLPFTNVVEKV